MIFISNGYTAPIAKPFLFRVYIFNILACVRSLCFILSSASLVLSNSIIEFSNNCVIKRPCDTAVFFGVLGIYFSAVFVVLFSVVFNPSIVLLQQIILIFFIMRLTTLFTPRLKAAWRTGEFIKITNIFIFPTLATLFSFHFSSFFLYALMIPHYERNI